MSFLKYKAWDIDEKRWIPEEEIVVGQKNGLQRILVMDNASEKWVERDAANIDVLLFTGYSDINGKEIYVGDIVAYNQYHFNTTMILRKRCVIKYDKGYFEANGVYIYGTAAGMDNFEINIVCKENW